MKHKMSLQNPPPIPRLVPHSDWNVPGLDYTKARGVQRVNLREVPLESVIEFYGVHPASRYRCRIIGAGGEREIKIWFSHLANCAIGSIDSIISMDLKKFQPGAEEATFMERAVMEIGKLYMMPHFEHRQQDGRHSIALNYSTRRGEGYSRILLQVPEELVK